ncbi:MAG TPA: IclR family transcriptional regulator C-terminal domain-containing protein [Solirubrobacteraceae bacterium]
MTASRAAGPRREVGSVARAVALLDALGESEAEAGLGVNELARRIGVNPSTASRLLATLEQARLVERAPGGPYRLGLKLVALSDRVLARLDVRERARPWLVMLVEETGETATLSIPGAGEAITVDFVPAPSSVVSMARLGRPSVSHATAAGKVMLAFGDDVALSRESELTAYTERTITDPDALVRSLAVVRERGIAEAVGEREPDLAAMAAPVLGRAGELVALSDRVLARLDVRERARPWLVMLVEETGETATLSIPGAGEAITVDFVPAPSSVVSMARLGRPSISHATAAGKVMLAFGADVALSRESELTAYTERTVTDPDTLVRSLAVVRERGIAEAVGEREPDLAAMAAPVLGRAGELVAIIGLQGPAGRLPSSKRRALEAPLRRAAAEVGRLLGGPGAVDSGSG